MMKIILLVGLITLNIYSIEIYSVEKVQNTEAIQIKKANPTSINNKTESCNNQVLVNETFDLPDGPVPSQWWSEGCVASVKDGRLFVDADTVSPRQATVWLDQELSGNLRITFDVHIVNSSDTTNNINCFMFYSQPDGSSLRNSRGQRSESRYASYHHLSGFIFTNVLERGHTKARFRLRRNPGFHLLTETMAYENIQGKTYHIEIERTCNKLSYSVDGNKVIDYEEEDGSLTPHEKGFFGFRTWHTAIWWDNLKIVQIE